MKILHVAESIWGGCGTYLNEILPLQAAAVGEHNIRALVPLQHRAHLRDIDERSIATFDRAGRLSGLPRLTAAAIGEIRRWRPDLVHAHSTFAGAVVRALGVRWWGAPVVYCPHGWVFDVDQSGLSRWITTRAERALSLLGNRIVAISQAEALQARAAGIDAARIVVIPNGIRAERMSPPTNPIERWDTSRLKLLFVGRLDRQKGVDILLEAVRPLADRVSVRIVGEQVVGSGRQTGAGENPAHIELLGWRSQPEVAGLMDACDVVVMPSRWEGFGLVAIEAMRAGKPVLASRVGGLPEIVLDGVTGRLFPVGDAKALRDILSNADPRDLLRMGAAGSSRFRDRYTSDRTARKLLDIYREILAKPGAMTTSEAATRSDPGQT